MLPSYKRVIKGASPFMPTKIKRKETMNTFEFEEKEIQKIKNFVQWFESNFGEEDWLKDNEQYR